jgi:tRNA(Ile)-lysidine synthetase-like protein
MALPKKAIETVLTDFNKANPNRDPVVVACSGGVDSMALLFCLSLTKVKLHPIFVMHRMRPHEEEGKSLLAVERLARRLDISMSVVPPPKNFSLQTEEEAREFRYSKLVSLAQAFDFGLIATAHHADDQLETVLMRLCRGSGITGLAAIPLSSRVPTESQSNCRVIRPMLRISKADCIEICESNEIDWHEDATNSDITISRNRLRHDVLPVLKELYPQASLHASEAAFKLRDIAGIIENRVKVLRSQETEMPGGILMDVGYLKQEHEAVQQAYFRDVAKRLNGGKKMDRINTQMSEQILRAVSSGENKSFDWPGMKIEVKQQAIYFKQV